MNQKKSHTNVDYDTFFKNLGTEKLAWLAGLFQAEAYFHEDKRVRATSSNEEYTPPPPIPMIKLEMVEQDLMEHLGEILDENVITVNRKTSAGKRVYKITISARNKVEAFLKAILPFVIGKKNSNKIKELLNFCQEYKTWVGNGGKKNAAKLANKASQVSKKLSSI